MRLFLKGLNEFFSRLGEGAVFGVVIFLVILLGCLDYATGFEVSTSFLYLVPIFIATWYLTLQAGYFITLLSVVTWAAANYLAGEVFSNEIIRYWNFFARLSTFLIFAWLLNELKNALHTESEMARKDSLTGIKNHREFHAQAKLELSRASHLSQPLSLIYFDLDSFKKINDEQGHTVGDQLLQTVTRVVSNIIRKSDLFARLGGDEFALLLPNTTQEEVCRVVRKIETALTNETAEIHLPVTISVGIVTFKSLPQTVDEMINKADTLMYQAKSLGKGRSVYFLQE